MTVKPNSITRATACTHVLDTSIGVRDGPGVLGPVSSRTSLTPRIVDQRPAPTCEAASDRRVLAAAPSLPLHEQTTAGAECSRREGPRAVGGPALRPRSFCSSGRTLLLERRPRAG